MTTIENNQAKAIATADKTIKAQWTAKGQGDAAMSVIGQLMARATADSVYMGDALVIATRVYGLRGDGAASAGAQVSKLANFATVAMHWNRKGADVIDALTAISAGKNKRYETTQSVLVQLKKLKDKARPTDAEVAAMWDEAAAPKAKTTKTSADTCQKLLDDLGSFAKGENYPAPLATAFQHITTYRATLGPTTADMKKNGDKLAIAKAIADAVAAAE